MWTITLKRKSLTKDEIMKKLKENGIMINHYAEEYISHPHFFAEHTKNITVTIASLKELGLEKGATLNQLFHHIQNTQYMPCPPDTGFFLRLAWLEQPKSHNSILTGTHASPDQAVTVLSKLLEEDDTFPKGLYLRNVDDNLWLRGYACDRTYCFPADALFAFETYKA